jgi:opacity protein-like surface antigen
VRNKPLDKPAGGAIVPSMSWSRNAVGTLVVALCGTTTPLAAQGIRAQFGMALARAMPTGDYHAIANGEGFDAAWQGMALLALSRSGSHLGLRLDGTAGTNGANDQLASDLTAQLGQPSDEETKLLGANLDLTYTFRPSARFSPYLLGGLGMYHVTVSATSGGATSDTAETKLAWNLGGGLSYGVGAVTPFLEARYVSVASVAGFPRTTLFPISLGVRVGAR